MTGLEKVRDLLRAKFDVMTAVIVVTLVITGMEIRVRQFVDYPYLPERQMLLDRFESIESASDMRGQRLLLLEDGANIRASRLAVVEDRLNQLEEKLAAASG